MTRTYQRKFDWNKAKARYANGETIRQIASSLDVSWSAVQRIVVPGVKHRMAEYSKQLAGKGTCERCGAPTNLNAQYNGSKHCKTCAAIVRATTVRETTLWCLTCHQWKPDDDFPHDKRRIARRGRHRQCTPCNTQAKRDWRQRNIEKVRAYDRDYKAKQRAQNRTHQS